MKTTAVSLLPALGSLASAAVLAPRQFPAGFQLKTVPKAFVEDLPPTITDRPNVVRQLVGFGPFALAGSKQTSGFHRVKEGLCSDCTILKGKAGIRIKGEAGAPDVNESKKVYIHHILTNEVTKPVRTFLTGCSTSRDQVPKTSAGPGLGEFGSKFIGTGDDQAALYAWYTPQDIKLDTGYYITPNYTFLMNSALVNEETTPKEVYVTMEIEYVKGKTAGDTRDVLMGSGPCGNPGLVKTSTTGPTSTESGNYFFREDGHIVYAKGHLHAGGEKMEMYINGKLVCTSTASYDKGEKGPITGVTTCPAIPVKKGDALTMKSYYDGSKHQMRHDHGMMGGAAPKPSGGMGGMGGMNHGSHGGESAAPDSRPDVMGMWAIAFSNATAPTS